MTTTHLTQIPSRQFETKYRFYVGQASFGYIVGKSGVGTAKDWMAFSRSGVLLGQFSSKRDAVAFMVARFGA